MQRAIQRALLLPKSPIRFYSTWSFTDRDEFDKKLQADEPGSLDKWSKMSRLDKEAHWLWRMRDGPHAQAMHNVAEEMGGLLNNVTEAVAKKAPSGVTVEMTWNSEQNYVAISLRKTIA